MKAIRTILACIRKADCKYNLFQHGDKIVIGLSGGKDSICLLYALSLYQKFSHCEFTIQPVILDLGFDNFDAKELSTWVSSFGYNLIVKDCKDVYQILKANQVKDHHLPCSICSKMKKAAINKVANELGFNKVAFAHHADDAIETLVMNEIYGGRIATFSPKMFLTRSEVGFIRPLCLCREKDIIKLIKEEQLPIFNSFCPADKHTTRTDIKELLNGVYKKYPESYENFLSMLDNYSKQDIWDKEESLQVNQSGLTLKSVVTPSDMLKEINIRHIVFCKEQSFDYELDIEKDDFEGHHFLIYENDVCIGTINYVEEDNRKIHLRRFAILKEYRNKGYGREVFTFITNYITKRYTPCEIFFDAEHYLQKFYESLGYKAIGNTFKKEHRICIKMSKQF